MLYYDKSESQNFVHQIPRFITIITLVSKKDIKVYYEVYFVWKQNLIRTYLLQTESKYSSYLQDIEGCEEWLAEYKDELDNNIKKYQSFIDKVNRIGRKM